MTKRIPGSRDISDEAIVAEFVDSGRRWIDKLRADGRDVPALAIDAYEDILRRVSELGPAEKGRRALEVIGELSQDPRLVAVFRGFHDRVETRRVSPDIEAKWRRFLLERARRDIEALAVAEDELTIFCNLPYAAAGSFHLEQFATAREYAQRALDLAPRYEASFSYTTGIHVGHTVLGLVALTENDIPAAIRELHASAAVREFAPAEPTMQLAKQLLRLGLIEPVLQYLAECRSAWDEGHVQIGMWERVIRDGGVPNCFGHAFV